jgi:type I restriction enzyme S subunit
MAGEQLPDGWHMGKLGDFITLQRGFDLPEYQRQPGKVPVVTSSGITGSHSEARVSGPGVVMGRYGTLGQMYYLTDDYWPHNTSLYVKDFKGNHPRFVYYFLQTVNYQAHNDKSSVPGLNRNHLHASDVKLPPLPVQRRIAHILGTLDDKIEHNRRTNATLEGMARALFKSWFVDFDPVRAKADGRPPAGMSAELAALFPDSFEDSPLGKVPRGWGVVALDEVATFVKGISYKSAHLQDSSTALVNLKCINRGGGYREDGLKPYTGPFKPEQKLSPGDIVVAHTDVTQAAEVLGRPARVRSHPDFDTLIASLDLVIVRPSVPHLSHEFVYELLSRDEFREHAYGYSNGTTVLHLNKKALPNYEFVMPPIPIIQSFNDVVSHLFAKSDTNEQQTRTLAALRDALLPRLLSGAVAAEGVKHIENLNMT